ncbi:MAG: UDP-glucose 4-epimerase GalE [Salibacteraceae bacterium]
MPNKILVTGGAGYIGSHTIVALLENGLEPIIVDNFSNANPDMLERLKGITGRDVKFYRADCTDRRAMRMIFESEKDLKGVIHFAALKSVAESILQPGRYYQNNLNALWTVAEVMQEFDIPNLVFSSSATVYGQPVELPVNEKTPLSPPTNPYGTTKLQGEQYLRDLVPSGAAIRPALLRYFNPVGAHPSGLIGEAPLGAPSNLVPYITQTAVGMRQQLTIFGNNYNTPDGTCNRDFIHVMDLAEAHVACLQHLLRASDPGVETFNLGTGRGVSVWNAVTTFEEISGKALPYQFGPRRNGDVPAIWANVDRAQEVLNWKAERSFALALEDAYRWQLKAAS